MKCFATIAIKQLRCGGALYGRFLWAHTAIYPAWCCGVKQNVRLKLTHQQVNYNYYV